MSHLYIIFSIKCFAGGSICQTFPLVYFPTLLFFLLCISYLPCYHFRRYWEWICTYFVFREQVSALANYNVDKIYFVLCAFIWINFFIYDHSIILVYGVGSTFIMPITVKRWWKILLWVSPWWWLWWWWWWWWIVFVVWFPDERWLALFPAGTIVRDPHHHEPQTRREQGLNLRRIWVQA